MLDSTLHPKMNNLRTQRHCVLYAWVSSKEQQREGFSIPAQRRLLRRYAGERELVIAAEFTDVETAGRSGRTGFTQMVDYLKRNAAKRIILVEKTDRLHRNLRDWVTIDELNPEIHLVKEGAVLSEHSVSAEKFIYGIKSLVAKNYLDNLKEETKKGLLEKAQQGLWPSRAPLGYRNVVGAAGKRIIEPDPKIAATVSELFSCYAAGSTALRALTKKAAALGLRTPYTDKRVPCSRIHAMLRNPIYMGEFVWNGQRYQGQHEPLVNRATWNRVQDVLSGRAPKRRSPRRKNQLSFSRLIECGVCRGEDRKFHLVGEMKKERYVYYRCEECKRQNRATYIREEKIVAAFVACWHETGFSVQMLEWIASALFSDQSTADQSSTGGADACLRHQQALAAIRSQRDETYDDRLAGLINSEYFAQRARSYEAQIAYHQRCIADLESQKAPAESAPKLELGNVIEMFNKSANTAKRRRLIETLHSNCVWTDGKLHVEWRQTLRNTEET